MLERIAYQSACQNSPTDKGPRDAGVELQLDTARLTGPWPDGPISVTVSGPGTAVVTNDAENAATITQIPARLPDGTTQTLADNLNISLNTGAVSTAALTASPSPGAEFIAAYTLADTTTAVIGEENI